MITPALSDFMQLAVQGNIVPIYEVLRADTETPISVYTKLVGEGKGFILESVEGGERLGRYSFIGLQSFREVMVHGKQVTVTEAEQYTLEGNPFEILRGMMKEFTPAESPGLPRFYGGAVGYFGYDLIEHLEKVSGSPRDELNLPDSYLMFPEVVVVFDHVQHSTQVVACVRINDEPEKCYQHGLELLQQVKVKLGEPLKAAAASEVRVSHSAITSNLSKEQYMKIVEQAKEYIRAGDVFQVVLSQRLSAEIQVPPFEVYRTLRSLNPSPYLYYINFGDLKIVGSSPEMLTRLENNIVETQPIAGTRPRGRNKEEDEQLAAELLADEKERAEHIMLVDLGRNDIGRVSRYGTVTVPTFMKIGKYSHVMHIISGVQGELLPDKDAIDALTACFPAGTVSGAPKVRAMEIISELENNKRGPYAGAVGYLGFSGNMDTCITIRTFVIAAGKVYVQAGAGIVADSVPETEYQETLNKAKGLLRALAITEEGQL